MAHTIEPVSQAIAGSRLGAIAPYIRDEQYTLRDVDILRKRSRRWAIFAIVIAVIGVVGFLAMLGVWGFAEDMLFAGGIFLFPALGLSLIFSRGVFRMRDVTGHFPELAAYDARKPILYLRNFAEENPELVTRGGHGVTVTTSFEHSMATALWSHGRLVALGDPKQRRQSGSASRLFVSDEGWQASVQALMAESQAIIIHYFEGANVDWEVDQSERFPDTPRLILINFKRDRNQKRVSDLPAPRGLQAAFAQSKAKLPSAEHPIMVGAIRTKNGERIVVHEGSGAGLGLILGAFKKTFKTRPSPERLPPPIKKLRDRLHNWSYMPSIIALLGVLPLALLWGAVLLAPGLFDPTV